MIRLFSLLFTIFTNVSYAQVTPTVIRDRPSCSACRISLSLKATLGDANGGPGELHGNVRGVRADDAGNLFVSFFAWGELLAQFDRAGSFQRRIGRLGSGPGEYRAAWLFEVIGDSLFIIDPGTARLTVHSLRLNRELRSASVSWLARASALARSTDGTIVGNTVVETPEEAGYPLHQFSADGKKLKSFGSVAPSLRPDLRLATMRSVAPGLSGGMWVAQVSSYDIELYDRAGSLIQLYRREADWFPPGSGRIVTAQPDGEPPQPKVVGVQEDERGRLWVLSIVADSGWRRAFSADRLPPRRAGAPQYYGVEDTNRLYDSVIEVIDPRSGKLISSTRVDEALAAFAGRNMAWSSVEQGGLTGVAQVRLWGLAFREH